MDLHDPEIEMLEHCWRVIDYLDLVGDSGMVCNIEKLQFSDPIVDFAGFRISPDTVELLPKYLDAIRHFLVPKCTTDIRVSLFYAFKTRLKAYLVNINCIVQKIFLLFGLSRNGIFHLNEHKS